MNKCTSAWAAAHAPAGIRWGKKALSLLLSLVLYLTLLPGAALAAGGTHAHYLCGGDFCTGVGHTESGKTTFETAIKQENGKLYVGDKECPLGTDYYYPGKQAYMLDGGTYYLDSDLTLDKQLATKGEKVTLCLNGHSITGNGGSAALVAGGAGLVLTDCKTTGTITGTGESVNVYTAAVFDLYGGTITGNGTGVHMNGLTSNTTFNMYGGTITKNSDIGVMANGRFNLYGGSISDNGSEGVRANATFEMHGGTISGNKKEGVRVNSSFNMYDGAITGNTSSNYGGGVYAGGTFTMYGGSITGNFAGESKAASNVYLPEGKTITVGGALTSGSKIGVTTAAVPAAHIPVTIAAGADGYTLTNTDASAFTSDENYVIGQDTTGITLAPSHTHKWRYDRNGDTQNIVTRTCPGTPENGSVDLDGGRMTISAPANLTYDGTPKAAVLTNTMTDEPDPVITYAVKDGENWEDLPTGTIPVEPGTYRAMAITSKLYPIVVYTIHAHEHCICGAAHKEIGAHTTGKTVTWVGVSELDKIKAGAQSDPNYYYLTGPVTLSETWKVPNNVVLCLNGQTITANFDGPAITVQAPFDFTLTDCADTPGVVTHGTDGDTGSKYKGRGVEVQGKTKDGGVGAGFDLYGGSIRENALERNGTAQGGGVYAGWSSVFRMYGGSITGNSAISIVNDPADTTDAAQGGGVYSTGTFDLYGGSITDNRVEANYTAQGGGVYAADRLNISGAPVITNNTAVKSRQSVKNNYYGSRIAYVLKTLADGAQIGVSQDISSPFATGWDTGTKYTLTPEDAEKFIPDDSGYIVMQDGNYLILSKPVYTVTFHANGGTLTGGSVRNTDRHGQLVTLPIDPTRSGYTFDGWYTAADGGDRVDKDKVYTANTDLYAHWTRTGTSSGGSGSSGSSSSSGMTSTAIKDIRRARSGETVRIDMKGETKVPASVFDAAYGKDITLEFDMGGGTVWSVSGLDIPKGGVSLDLGIRTGTKSIPVKVINAITGEASTVQLRLSHDGAFGLRVTLSLELGKELDGMFANLYYYNDKTGALEFQSASKIGGGTASWPFAHASEYVVVIDALDHAPASFVDVTDGAYYRDAVLWAAQKGITSGTDATHFSPKQPCTRAQIVTFLWRAAGSPEPKSMSGFADVSADSYYAKAVAWAVENGITAGIGDDKFAADAPCTRAQAVTFLFRYEAPEAVTLQELVSGFADAASVPGYALSAMNWALAAGIVTGDGQGLMPNDACTRAQIVTFLFRAYQGK